METIKKPEVLLTAGNTVAIVGVSIYFYKQISAIKTELAELTEHLKTSVKKFADIQESTASRDEMKNYLTALNLKIEQTQKELKNLDSGEGVDLIEEALEDLSDALNESGIEWTYPPKRRRRRRRAGGRKKKGKARRKVYSDSESESESESDSESDVEKTIAKERSKRAKSRRKG